MDFNTILSLNQTIHNMGAVLFAAGPFYILLLLRKRRDLAEGFADGPDGIIEGAFSFSVALWLFVLVLQGVTGASFALISLLYEGELPQIAPLALAALAIKVSGAAAAFFISLYLMLSVTPRLTALVGEFRSEGGAEGDGLREFQRLRVKRERLTAVLLLLSIIILTGAAFLRWNI